MIERYSRPDMTAIWSEEGRYYFGDYAADVACVARHFDTPPVLVGASLGGIASLWAVAHATGSQLASGLVLVDIATRMEASGAERIRDFMTSRPEGFASLEEAADAIAEYLPHRKRRTDLSGLAKNLRRGDDGRYRWHWDPAFLSSAETAGGQVTYESSPLLDAARKLTAPALLVRGRASDVVSEEGAEEFRAAVPHAKYVDVSGAGHMVAGDRNDLFTDAVVTFLDGRGAPAAHA